MAVLLDVTFQDINQLQSKSSMWVESEEVAADVIVALKAASNAKIIKATLSTPLDLTPLGADVASNANVETASCKAIISMRGLDADSTGQAFARARVGVPAPQGGLINSLNGDLTNLDALALMSKVLSKTGVQMTAIESIKYSR